MYSSKEAERAVRVYEETAILHAKASKSNSFTHEVQQAHVYLAQIAASTVNMMKLYQMISYLATEATSGDYTVDDANALRLRLTQQIAQEDIDLRARIKTITESDNGSRVRTIGDCQSEHGDYNQNSLALSKTKH